MRNLKKYFPILFCLCCLAACDLEGDKPTEPLPLPLPPEPEPVCVADSNHIATFFNEMMGREVLERNSKGAVRAVDSSFLIDQVEFVTSPYRDWNLSETPSLAFPVKPSTIAPHKNRHVEWLRYYPLQYDPCAAVIQLQTVDQYHEGELAWQICELKVLKKTNKGWKNATGELLPQAELTARLQHYYQKELTITQSDTVFLLDLRSGDLSLNIEPSYTQYFHMNFTPSRLDRITWHGGAFRFGIPRQLRDDMCSVLLHSDRNVSQSYAGKINGNRPVSLHLNFEQSEETSSAVNGSLEFLDSNEVYQIVGKAHRQVNRGDRVRDLSLQLQQDSQTVAFMDAILYASSPHSIHASFYKAGDNPPRELDYNIRFYNIELIPKGHPTDIMTAIEEFFENTRIGTVVKNCGLRDWAAARDYPYWCEEYDLFTRDKDSVWSVNERIGENLSLFDASPPRYTTLGASCFFDEMGRLDSVQSVILYQLLDSDENPIVMEFTNGVYMPHGQLPEPFWSLRLLQHHEIGVWLDISKKSLPDYARLRAAWGMYFEDVRDEYDFHGAQGDFFSIRGRPKQGISGFSPTVKDSMIVMDDAAFIKLVWNSEADTFALFSPEIPPLRDSLPHPDSIFLQ